MHETPPTTESDPAVRLKRLRFRAWHRGTREADMIIGGFIDKFGDSFSAEEMNLFEALLEEQDLDILNWVTGKEPPPAHFDGSMMQAMQKLDYLDPAR